VTERPVFESPVPVSILNDPVAKDQDPSLPADQLEILFFSDRAGTADLWRSVRSTSTDDWTTPEPVAELNDPVEIEYNPTLSADGLRIWFCSSRDPAGIWYSDRPSRVEPFSLPTPISIDSLADENLVIGPSLLADFLTMALSIGVGETRDLYEVTRPDLVSPWSSPKPITGINSDAADSTPHLYDDGLQLFFASGRSGAGDLFWAYREGLDEPVTQVTPLDELNDPDEFESYPHLTADRKMIYFGSSRSGGTDIYMAPAKF
jgi:Tol biopolymer transport system component